MRSIFEQLDDWVGRHPDKLLFCFLDLAGRETESYSYASFRERTFALARHLRVELNFQPGERLLLAYPPGLEMICAFFGCARAGLIPVPVYPPAAHGFQSALYRMAHIAADCEAAAVLTSNEYLAAVNARLAKNGNHGNGSGRVTALPWIATEEVRGYSKDERGTAPNHSPDVLFLQYTSGSTENPRGVVVTHENILHNRSLVADHPSPVAVSWLPQHHDMGLIGYYIFAALSGATTYGFSPTDFIQRPALWLESIKKYRASASSAPNFAFEYCLRPGRIPEEVLANADLSSIRFLMTAAEPVCPRTFRRFLRAFEPRGLKPESFFVAYGLAENTLAVSNYGRNVLSMNKNALSLRRVRTAKDVSAIASSRQLISCGRPLTDVAVRIVDPDIHVALEEGHVGEIWIDGKSKCRGYWNQPELTRQTFHARVVGDVQSGADYLRTGDLGFLLDGELYVCGRAKDTIIIRGQNYYPQDIERIVEDSSELVRKTCVAAFEINEEHEPALAVVAEVKRGRAVPDPRELARAIRSHLNVEAAVLALVAPKSLPKTSSGKMMRQAAKQLWLNGQLRVIEQLSRETEPGNPGRASTASSPFQALKERYNLREHPSHTLIEAGIDSLDLVVLLHEIQETLKSKGAEKLAGKVDVRLIQELRVEELLQLAALFEQAPEAAVLHLRTSLSGVIEEHRRREEEMMRSDRDLTFTPRVAGPARAGRDRPIFITGGTGFLGPFLLRSLLEQTDAPLYVLTRAEDRSRAIQRLKGPILALGPSGADLSQRVDERVRPLCGDLGAPNLGLDTESWRRLSEEASTIYHNGAAVNYLFNYEKLRPANIAGTNEVLRLASEGTPKVVNYVSTTFIFGWAVKSVLYETDTNEGMELLDFGYSQSKWVAEQVVMAAMRKGIAARIFRPALISPSVEGSGVNLDIAIRLLAFMVNHGIGVEALNQVSFVPADIVANNIVAIANQPATVNGVYHVVRDEYANMVEITDIIGRVTGRPFQLFGLHDFVPEVIKRCTREDPLFPLLDFLINSLDRIRSMEFKRYDSSDYQVARDASQWGRRDPSLEDTVLGILRFMRRKELISIAGALDLSMPRCSASTS